MMSQPPESQLAIGHSGVDLIMSYYDAFNLIERNLIAGALIELDRLRAGVVGNFLCLF
jgi:hypothetical protein